MANIFFLENEFYFGKSRRVKKFCNIFLGNFVWEMPFHKLFHKFQVLLKLFNTFSAIYHIIEKSSTINLSTSCQESTCCVVFGMIPCCLVVTLKIDFRVGLFRKVYLRYHFYGTIFHKRGFPKKKIQFCVVPNLHLC